MMKSYKTNSNIAKKSSEIGQIMKLANESTVQLSGAVHLRAVRCGNAYIDERNKKVFIDGLPLTVPSGVRKL